MAGNTPMRLFLTCVPVAAGEAFGDTLRRDFLADLRVGAREGAGGAKHEWGKVVIGETEISIEIDLLSSESPRGLVCPVILLHSEAYGAARDLVQGHVRHRRKEPLIEFCLKAAAAVNTEGFRLQFADDEKPRPLAINRLVTDLTTNGLTGLLDGVAITSPSLDAVNAAWPLARERSGYLVLDFI